MTSHGTRRLLILGKLRGVGPATLNRLATRPSLGEAPISTVASWEPAVRAALEHSDALTRAEERAATELDEAARIGARVISPLDEEYPPALAAIPDRPAWLFVKGNLEAVRHPGVSVIGTREPTRHGIVVARRISEYFATHGWPIVSGLAFGIDGVAHQATLGVRGRTVAVLAHGLDMVYPRKHRPLAERILADGGALVSEYPPGAKPFGPQFVKRDRIQAGLTIAVVLVQTDVRGGSLHASRASLQYGRFLAVPVPTPKDVSNAEPKIQGVLKLLNAPPTEVARFLECPLDALRRIVVFRSRADYAALEERILTVMKAGFASDPGTARTALPLWDGT